jgi:fructose-1,6-bisphosphatase I
MRRLAAVLGELHRILLVAGCFLRPAERHKGFENGRPHLNCEAVLIAYVIETGGGKATNGRSAIRASVPRDLHEKHAASLWRG